MNQQLRQVAAVIRLELKKTFFSRRGWWVYLLALAPVGMTLVHSLVLSRLQSIGRPSHGLAGDTQGFAMMFQVYFLRLAIFFGCVGVFSNLFRGEMLEKTLHYYFLTPMRRELLVAGKYLSGLMVTLVLFLFSVTASFYLLGRHQGAAWSDFLMRGPGLAQMGSYALVAALACVGYGAIFLLAGLLIRNPMIPAAAVWVWENLNPFLPGFLKKISVIFYLKSLCPLSVPVSGPFSVLVTDTDPTPAWLAVPGLLIVALALLTYTAISARRAEISYGE
jgi:ABC-type transport system involved in multi-copper enzyme maturation permease subunit